MHQPILDQSSFPTKLHHMLVRADSPWPEEIFWEIVWEEVERFEVTERACTSS